MQAGPGYVDIYLLPVPENNLEAYRSQATTFGMVAKEHGAVSYREFRGDGVTEMVDGEQIADMSQMRYGGFQTFVNP